MKFDTKEFLLIVLALVIGGTLANLIALKIAADQVSAQIDAGVTSSPLLSLLAKK